MRKNLFIRGLSMFMVGMVAAGISGCGAASSDIQASTSASEKQGDSYHVGIILKTTSSEYWGYVIAGIEAAEKDLENITVDVKGATSDTAFDEQQNM